MEITIEDTEADSYGLKLDDTNGGMISITIDTQNDQLIVQRFESEPEFAPATFSEPQIVDLDGLKTENIRMIFDTSLFEIYINDGIYTFVNRIFINTNQLNAEFFAENGSLEISDIKFWDMDSAWDNINN